MIGQNISQLQRELSELKRSYKVKKDALGKRLGHKRSIPTFPNQVGLTNTNVMANKSANAKELAGNMLNLFPNLTAGNVGEINRVIWPFWFTHEGIDVASGGDEQTAQIKITNEACFVWTHMIKTVFIRTGTTPNLVYSYLDPDLTTNDGITLDLNFSIKNPQTGMTFFDNPVSMDCLGTPKDPFVLPQPIMHLPNEIIQLNYFNNHASNIYRVKTVLFGYRIRLEDQAQILSLVKN